jgi:hypothetical protein
MIARTSLVLALLVPAAVVPFFVSNPAAAAAQEGEREGNPALHAYMEDLGGTLRKLGRGLKEEGAMATGLTEVLRLQRATLDAKEQLPVVVSSIEDEKKRLASTIEYRTQMHALATGLFTLELAYLEGDAGKVEKQLKELDKVKKAGHGQFKPD